MTARTAVNKIKFSHSYLKFQFILWSEPCVLIQVLRVKKSDLTKEFIDYDTTYINDGEDKDKFRTKQYPLNSGNYLMLFFKNNNTIFTTLRSDYPEMKYEYYKDKIGQDFFIEISNK